jgi:hypothetical protein
MVDVAEAAETVSKTYPLDFRMQVVATFMNPLSDVAFRRLIVHKLWLENKGDVQTGNAAVRDLIWGKVKEGGGYEIEPLFTAVEAEALRLDNNRAGRRRISERTRDWVMLWVKTQTVKNAAPKGRGAEDDERFCQIRDFMRAGYKDDHNKGVKRLFKSVWHARALKPELDAICGELRKGKGMSSRWIWFKLRRKWPKFRKSKERRKKVRAAGECQAAAKRMCGLLPVHNELARWLGAAQRAQITTRLSGREVKWDPKRADQLWSYDCAQVDVLKLITEGKVVHWAGDDQEVVEDPLENKSVGDLPKLFCFFLGHPDFGVRAWVMHTGSNGGAVGAWEGVRFWTDELSDSVKREIAAHDHCNYPEAVNANPAELRGGDFDPRKFRVRYTQRRCQCCLDYTLPWRQ